MAAVLPTLRWREPSILPGFGIALGITLTALSLVVLIPLAALFLKAASAGPADIWAVATSPRTLAALRLSFTGALFAASVNAVFGLILAWVLVRYEFPGRRLVDAAVDLPFACRPRSRASRWQRSMRPMAGSAACSRRSTSRSPIRRSASWWR